MSKTTSRDNILKVGAGHYRVFIELPKGPDGRRRRESLTVHGTLEQAKAVKAKLLSEQAIGAHVARSDQLVSEYLESWLSWKRSRVGPTTWERYASLLRRGVIPTLGHLRLQELTSQHLDDFYAESLASEPGRRPDTTISPTTVHHRHIVLKTALERAVELGAIARNPARYTTPPRPARPELRVLTEDEAQRLLTVLKGTRAELPAYLALTTGARLGEILALRWNDVDLDAGVAHIRRTLVDRPIVEAECHYTFKEPKSGRGRSVDLGADTIAKLQAHKGHQEAQRGAAGDRWVDHDLIITRPNGRPARTTTISAWFRETVRPAGFAGLRFHDLRHSHASILLKAGISPHVVSKRLGHSTVGFTLQVYAHVLPGQQRQAADTIEAAILKAAEAQNMQAPAAGPAPDDESDRDEPSRARTRALALR